MHIILGGIALLLAIYSSMQMADENARLRDALDRAAAPQPSPASLICAHYRVTGRAYLCPEV